MQGVLHPKTTDLSKRFRCLAVVLMSFFVLLTSGTASAQNIQLYKSYAGNLAFKLNGNSLRNATNECQALTQSSSSVSIPAGSTLKAAYLYWSGSGQQDTSVTLNGSQVLSLIHI